VRDGCGICKFCEQGYHWHCTNSPRIYGGTDPDQGSFATKSVWPDTRLVRIPSDISSEDAGPFMCAGQTVFVPMLRTGIRSKDRVGVVGIGGLGHLAIQFAAGFGAQVVALSNSDNKKQEAFAFGATEFHSAVDSSTAAQIEKLDHLIVTTSVQPDWDL
jgi:D-arabinose 1-dehydrogenase-like Zn-dependent alcohol dehydrogenase